MKKAGQARLSIQHSEHRNLAFGFLLAATWLFGRSFGGHIRLSFLGSLNFFDFLRRLGGSLGTQLATKANAGQIKHDATFAEYRASGQ